MFTKIAPTDAKAGPFLAFDSNFSTQTHNDSLILAEYFPKTAFRPPEKEHRHLPNT